MIFVSRGTQTIDITPLGWNARHGSATTFFAEAAALMTTLGTHDMVPDLREFVGMFSEVQVGAQCVQAIVLVRSDLTDEQLAVLAARLVEYLSGQQAHAVAEFFEDDTARILESSGAVEVGHRAPCAAGHPATEECDLCRGVCLSGGEHPPDAVALPAHA